jgi:3'-phosphoadenosine 5'-phosphosulfate sulfotransferase (PAPS reductase)/FAD synthetase
MTDDNVRHVLGLSGGKDSAALAIYLKDKELVPEIEYFFADTGAELPEVYEYLDRLEAYLGKEIVRLNSGREFGHWLKIHGNFLPSARQRWCTREMKIKPFERFVGEDEVVSYIGIRADEDREGYISHRPNIKAVFPFKESGLVREDIFRILEKSVGVPEYYKWRSRSGCYFCFFQRRDEWLKLAEIHPDLFEKAKEFEKVDSVNGERYTWVQGMTLSQLVERARENAESKKDVLPKANASKDWKDILRMNMEDDDPEEQSCLICSL